MGSSGRKFLWRILFTSALLAGFWPRHCAGMETVAELEVMLQQHGIAFDTNAVEDAAVRGMVKAIDPSARIVTAEEAENLRREVLGLSATGGVATNSGPSGQVGGARPLSSISIAEA